MTRPGGLILAVEPDNAARYWFSSIPSGMDAFELGRRFFAALAVSRGEAPHGDRVLRCQDCLPRRESIHSRGPFPVSGSYVGAPPPAVWKARAEAIEAAIAQAPDESLRRLGVDYAAAVARYGREATAAGSAFVEIQNAMLFASVGQRPDN